MNSEFTRPFRFFSQESRAAGVWAELMVGLGRYPCLGLLWLAHLVYWLMAFPNPDEAYYWLWGQHLDWSYYDHPPFHAWIQGLFSSLGHSRLVLRLPTLLSNGLFFVTYGRIVHYLYGAATRQAWWLTVLCCWSSPLYFLFLTLAWHDQWLIAFSLASAYCFTRFLDDVWHHGRGQSRLLYGGAAWLGWACLCKYTAVFVGLTMLVVIICQPRLRRLLWDRRLYGAVAIATLFALPILIWNSQNDWLSMEYYLTRSIDGGGVPLHPEAVVFFWLTSVLILSPPLAWVMGQCRSLRWLSCADRSPTYGWLAWGLFWVSTGLLSLVGLFSTALYYWNILAYLLLLPLVPAFFLSEPTAAAESHPTSTLRHRGWLNGIQLLGTVVAWLLVINYCLFPLAALVGPGGDPDGRMSFGWPQVAAAVTAQGYSTLLTTDYRSASALAYALNDDTVLAVSDRLDQFDVWARSRPFLGQPALVVADDWHPLSASPLELVLENRPGQDPETGRVATVEIRRFGIKIKDYYLYSGVVAAY